MRVAEAIGKVDGNRADEVPVAVGGQGNSEVKARHQGFGGFAERQAKCLPPFFFPDRSRAIRVGTGLKGCGIVVEKVWKECGRGGEEFAARRVGPGISAQCAGNGMQLHRGETTVMFAKARWER